MCGIGLDLLVGSDADAPLAHGDELPVAALHRRGPDSLVERILASQTPRFSLRLMGAVLSLRGPEVVAQPLADTAGNVLLFNGEIFGGDGVHVPPGASDTVLLLAALGTAANIPALLHRVQGPWALAYWHAASRTLWYGRDRLGRRSLLRAEPVLPTGRPGCHRLLLSSVAPPKTGASTEAGASWVWNELPADGMGSVRVAADGSVETRWHATPPQRPPMANWEAASTADGHAAAARLLAALSDAVRRRVSDVPTPPPPSASAPNTARVPPSSSARVAILFSGGIDCMVLARLADLHLPPDEPLDLLNVAFGDRAAAAPDRLTGRRGVRELRRLSPSRRFQLIEIDISLAELREHRTSLEELLAPSDTVMDMNIGAAFYFGARACGVLRCASIRQADGGGEEDEEEEEEECADADADGSARDAWSGQCRYGAWEAIGVVEAARARAPCRPCQVHTSLELSIEGGSEGGSEGGARVPSVELRIQVRMAGEGEVEGEGEGESEGAFVGDNASGSSRGVGRSRRGGSRNAVDAVGGGGGSSARRGGGGPPYRSGARVLLLGSGADEQLGGYGRHRTVFRKEGWVALGAELRAERERLWLRNLGRDDRTIADWGREARHPYLDETVMEVLATTPLPLICDLRLPPGSGDKLILRRLARLLGLTQCTALQKRAIQFGTRIANKNVCGQARLGDAMDLADLVHPDAECLSRGRRGTDASLPQALSKKRGTWASARAADT